MIKTMYIYWPEGLDKAPTIVQQCVQSWTRCNPTWSIVRLDNTNVGEYVQSTTDIISRITQNYRDARQRVMDILPLLILANHGGVWVDATVFCHQSLDEWLPIYAEEGFFAFDRPASDRLLSNWFLYGEPSNIIIQRWSEVMIQFYTGRVQDWQSKTPHFLPHFLFNHICSDPTIQQSWNRIPKIPANGLGPHYILEQGLFSAYDQEFKRNIDAKICPMYKLSSDSPIDKTNCKPGTRLFYLLSTLTENQHPPVNHQVNETQQPSRAISKRQSTRPPLSVVVSKAPSAPIEPVDISVSSIDLSKIVLILTSTVQINTKDCVFQYDHKARVETYMKSIEQWLSKTNFNIVLVENSGYPFHELADLMVQHCDRFEYLKYDEKKLSKDVFIKDERNKGVSELFAIQHAFRRSILAKTGAFFIKITARYFIPELEAYMASIRVQDFLALSQNNRNRCEMVGARRDMMHVIFNSKSMTDKKGQHIDVERMYRDRLGQLPQNKVIVCKEFEIEPTQRGGVQEIYTTI